MKVLISFCVTLLLAAVPAAAAYADDSVPELFSQSFTLESNGNGAGALNKVLKIIQQDTKNYTAMLRAGWLFYSIKDYGASVDYYRKAQALQPNSVEPLLGMTLPLMAAKKWPEAEDAAKKIIQRDENNYSANSRLAYILFSQGKYMPAKERYELVLSLYPADTDMKLGLAWTYVRLGNKLKAAQYFNEVLQVLRTSASALSGLEYVK